ncbi:MAG: nucleotide sugar dehydrogenase [Pseudomonadota bacterium]
MKISVLGLGYVGIVSASCLAKMGHDIIGVDNDKTKIQKINEGIAIIFEENLQEITQQAVNSGKLRATSDVTEAVQKTDISIVCVGTPSLENGDIDLTQIKNICTEIGNAIAEKNSFHIVVIRSTIIPKTMQEIVIPLLEKHSNKKAEVDFGVCNNPEFLREGSAVYDFFNPPKTVIGATDKKSAEIIASLYEEIPAPIIFADIEVVEMLKYADNSWHATKVVFANEIGRLCKAMNIDSHEVMDIFCKDIKLNISSAYLKPAFAFGGSCLPKDLKAVTFKSKELALETQLFDSLNLSNNEQIKLAFNMIINTHKKNIGFLGLSFKAGTDDLRASPIIKIIDDLLALNYNISAFDKNIKNTNIGYVKQDIKDVITNSEVIVIANNTKEFKNILEIITPNQLIIDLVRIKEIEKNHANYQGICW